MGTKVKMLNEYHMKALLERGTVDFNKFYKDELIDFIEVARKQKKELEQKLQQQEKEIERLNNIIEKLEQENAVLKTLVVNKDRYTYGIR